MKKKLFGFILAICLIIPCAFALSACGDDHTHEYETAWSKDADSHWYACKTEGCDKKKDKSDHEINENTCSVCGYVKNSGNQGESVPVTISFALDTETYDFSMWDYDINTNTYTMTYNNGAYWADDLFKVIATTEDGNTRTLYEATAQNPAGYKIATNIPDESTWGNKGIPAGTYTYKLYCEDFDNGQYKASACESETYNIVINNKVVDCSALVWSEQDEFEYIGGNNDHSVLFGFPYDLNNFEGIFNYQTSGTWRAVDAGTYTAEIDFDIDEHNYEYIGLPQQKTKTWTINKLDLTDEFVEAVWRYVEFNHIYTGNTITPVYTDTSTPVTIGEINTRLQTLFNDREDIAQHFTTEVRVTGFTAESTSSASEVNSYTLTPVFNDYQVTNTRNIELLDANQFTRTWTISKAKIMASDIYWGGNTSQTYGQTSALVFHAPAGVSYEIVIDTNATPRKITNEATNAGLYLAEATISIDEKYYELVGTPVLKCEWEIKKATLDIVGTWQFNKEITSDLSYQRPTLYCSSPYTVNYYNSNDEKVSKDGYLDAGTYKAVVTLDNFDFNNYQLVDDSWLEFEWNVVKANYPDAKWSYNYYPDIEWTDLTENTITLITRASGNYNFSFDNSFNNYDELSLQILINGGSATSETSISINATTAGTYVITVVINGQDTNNYNPIDADAYTLTVNIVEAQ